MIPSGVRLTPVIEVVPVIAFPTFHRIWCCRLEVPRVFGTPRGPVALHIMVIGDIPGRAVHAFWLVPSCLSHRRRVSMLLVLLFVSLLVRLSELLLLMPSLSPASARIFLLRLGRRRWWWLWWCSSRIYFPVIVVVVSDAPVFITISGIHDGSHCPTTLRHVFLLTQVLPFLCAFIRVPYADLISLRPANEPTRVVRVVTW